VERSWIIEALDGQKHERGSFRCGNPDLDRYLREVARRAGALGTGGTWVAVDGDTEPDEKGRRTVLGYYTVSMYSIGIEVLPESRRAGLPKPQVPAALLGRLAVDETCQRQGLGELLLMDALGRICAAAEQVPAHAIVLDATDEQAKAFYERYGFLELTDDPLHLYLPLDSVRKLLAEEEPEP
jgi:ribosomal protein S18 acetylase RimI-like enzyme